jgi:hypothetical protein
MDQETHAMRLVESYPDGTDEWLCPICGRHFLMSTTQGYTKTILETGDETAFHSGGKGGLSMKTPEISIEPPVVESDEKHLAPWLEWMDQVNYASLWNQAG